MASRIVTEAGFYAGRYLKPGQTYEDGAPKPSRRAIAAAEKAVDAARAALDKADADGKAKAEADLAAAEAELAKLTG